MSNIYNNPDESGGGGASINDSISAADSTYSSSKIDTLNAAQDANFEIDANGFLSPAGITVDASSSHNSIILNPSASANEYGTITMLSSVCIGTDVAKNGNAFSSVAIGHGSLEDGGSSSSVHIGINSGSNCTGNNHVHVGTGTGISDGGEGGAASTRNGDTAIGTFSGLLDGRNLNRDYVTFLGNRCNDAMQNYTNSTNITISDYDIIIGASDTNIGPDNNRPLIHANADDSSGYPDWSPGKPANLGTGDKVWQNLYLAGAVVFPNSASFLNDYGSTNMYDFCHYEHRVARTGFSDASLALLYCPTAVTAPSLGNITVVQSGSGTVYTAFRNTSGRTRRWLINASVVGADSLISLRGAINVTSALPTAAATNPRFGYSMVQLDSTGTAFANIPLSISGVVEVADDDYISVWVYGDTSDGGTWDMSGSAVDRYSLVTVSELPM